MSQHGISQVIKVQSIRNDNDQRKQYLLQHEQNIKIENQNLDIQDCKNQKRIRCNPWSFEQNLMYLAYLSSNISIFKNKKSNSYSFPIFRQMSYFIQSRKQKECSNHHNHKIRRYKQLDRIIEQQMNYYQVSNYQFDQYLQYYKIYQRNRSKNVIQSVNLDKNNFSCLNQSIQMTDKYQKLMTNKYHKSQNSQISIKTFISEEKQFKSYKEIETEKSINTEKAIVNIKLKQLFKQQIDVRNKQGNSSQKLSYNYLTVSHSYQPSKFNKKRNKQKKRSAQSDYLQQQKNQKNISPSLCQKGSTKLLKFVLPIRIQLIIDKKKISSQDRNYQFQSLDLHPQMNQTKNETQKVAAFQNIKKQIDFQNIKKQIVQTQNQKQRQQSQKQRQENQKESQERSYMPINQNNKDQEINQIGKFQQQISKFQQQIDKIKIEQFSSSDRLQQKISEAFINTPLNSSKQNNWRKQWSYQQNFKLLIFLQNNKEMQMKTKHEKMKIYQQMSDFIQSRHKYMCSSRYKYLLKKYKTIQRIMQYLKNHLRISQDITEQNQHFLKNRFNQKRHNRQQDQSEYHFKINFNQTLNNSFNLQIQQFMIKSTITFLKQQ